MLRIMAFIVTCGLAAPALAQTTDIPMPPRQAGVQEPGSPGIEAPRPRQRAGRTARALTPEQRLARVDQRCAQAGDNPRRARFCQRWQGMSRDQRAAFIDRAVQRAAQRRQRQPA